MFVFSERIRELREERNETQAEVAKGVGITLPSYAAYEKGRSPKFDVLRAIANYYDVTIDYLLGNSNARKAKNRDVMETLGLSEKAIEVLAGVYATNKNNTFTLTVNVLIEHRHALIAISRYLYYSLSRRRGFSSLSKDGKPYIMYDLVPRYAAANVDDPDMQNIVDPHLEIEFLNQDNLKDLQIWAVNKYLKELLDQENKLDRLPPYGKGKP